MADLTGGHTGRIFCIGFDSKKVCMFVLFPYHSSLIFHSGIQIVSCGEDQVSTKSSIQKIHIF